MICYGWLIARDCPIDRTTAAACANIEQICPVDKTTAAARADIGKFWNI